MMKRFFALLLLIALPAFGAIKPESYTTRESSHVLHSAVTTNALYWMMGHTNLGGSNTGVLRLWYSINSTNFSSVADGVVYQGGASEQIRDPSITWDSVNARWLVVATRYFDHGDGTFVVLSSTNGVDWTRIATPLVITPGADTRVYAPEWWTEGNTNFVIVFGSTNGLYKGNAYYMWATNSGYTGWSTPVAMVGITNYDTFIVKNGSTYYAYFAAGMDFLMMAASTSKAGPWFYLTNDFTGVMAASEGPSIVKVGNTWICYYFDNLDTLSYNYSTSTDLTNWTARILLGEERGGMVHGTCIAVTNTAAKTNACMALTLAGKNPVTYDAALGIVTATKFVGDGSGLTGVTTSSTNTTFGSAYIANLYATNFYCPSNTIAATNATGVPGQTCWSGGYVYICIATNSWMRAQLSGGTW